MTGVAVVTDSAANLPRELGKRYGITVVPLWLRMAGAMLRDEIETSAEAFYAQLRRVEGRPSTSQPSVGEFLEVYRALAEEASGILSIHLPARLSGTISSARAAAGHLTGVPITILDSGSASMGQGFAVLQAARLAARGLELDEVANAVERLLPRIHVLALLDTLEYLIRGGRFQMVANFVRPVLKTRALISLYAGQLRLLGLARRRAKGVAALLAEMAARVGDAPLHVAVMHADARERAERLRGEILARFNCVEAYITGLTPVLGAHGGPGMLGVAFYREAAPLKPAFGCTTDRGRSI